MKKHGFTLAEVLITMGIVGIVAAITAPVISGLMPDKDKLKVLKVYNVVSNLNKDFLSNPKFYPGPDTSDCEGFDCQGLERDDLVALVADSFPTIAVPSKGLNFAFYEGITKYKNLLAAHLDVETEPDSDYLYSFKDFTTSDGITWLFDRDSSQSKYILTVDFDNDNNSVNCSFSAQDCPKPDQFQFLIDKNGNISPNDPLTNAYLKNSKKLNDKKNDYKTAREDETNYPPKYVAPSIKPL